MSLFAKKLPLGMPTRTDAQVISMPFSGTRPVPGDVVKLTNDGKVEISTTNTETAYGIVTFYENDDICAVVTHGHVLAKLTSPAVGTTIFGNIQVIRAMPAADATGADSSHGYEVKVGG